MAMDWDHDVCLSCDNQTQEGEKFCSQACRLADVERSGFCYSHPATPAADASSSYSSQAQNWDARYMSSAASSASATKRHYFQLDAPINFSAFRNRATYESPPASPKHTTTTSSSSLTPTRPRSVSYVSSQRASLAGAVVISDSHTGRGLTLSPSRSSLSSVCSSTTTSTLSEETINQLRDYSGAFDMTRDWKRRVTFG